MVQRKASQASFLLAGIDRAPASVQAFSTRLRPYVAQSPANGMSAPVGCSSITDCAYVDARAAGDGGGTGGVGGIHVLGYAGGVMSAPIWQPRGGISAGPPHSGHGGVTLRDGAGRLGMHPP